MAPVSEQDRDFLRQALRLAKASAQTGGGPFGALVVRDGVILAEATNAVTKLHDPTAHAEVQAIRAACLAIGDFTLNGCTLYSSCEPCPMCLGAIYWARPDRVLYAASRTDAAAAGFDDAFIYEQLDVQAAERSIPFLEVNLPETSGVFEAWQANKLRTPY